MVYCSVLYMRYCASRDTIVKERRVWTRSQATLKQLLVMKSVMFDLHPAAELLRPAPVPQHVLQCVYVCVCLGSREVEECP